MASFLRYKNYLKISNLKTSLNNLELPTAPFKFYIRFLIIETQMTLGRL